MKPKEYKNISIKEKEKIKRQYEYEKTKTKFATLQKINFSSVINILRKILKL